MTKYIAISVALLAFCFSNANATVVWVAEDFDGGTVGAGLNPSGGLTVTTVSDPAGGTNMVGQIDVNGGGQWQSLLGGTTYNLPAMTIPNSDTVDVTYRVYLPSTTTAQLGTMFGNGDKSNSLFRVNGTAPDAYPPSQQDYLQTFPFDQWVTVTAGGVIPEFNNLPNPPGGLDPTDPTTSIQPIWSVHIPANGNGQTVPTPQTGLLMYIDDYQISVSETVPEPGSLALIGLGLASLLFWRRS